jgi:hypothetical protein
MIKHPELDGPFSVATAWTTATAEFGQQVQVPSAFANNRWNTTPGFYTKNAVALLAYKVAPAALTRCWSGDNPANPTLTVALAFPDAATATTVLTACGAT